MEENQNNLRVATYARVSTEEQREGQTIDSQVAEIERYASDRGWPIIGVYKDEGWSGSLLARPGLDKLRDDASKGLFNAVLINDVDRLARDVTHLGVIKRDLERHGQQVIFRKLPTEKSPTHNLMVNILGSFAEFERELIADRTRRGKRHKIEVRKEFLGSVPPYGFRYVRIDHASGNGGVLEVNPEEAAVVRQIYRWVDLEALSAAKVLGRLNKMHIPPRKGKVLWAKSSVLRILRSEVYAGTWYYYKFEACVPKKRPHAIGYKRTPKSSLRVRPKDKWLPLELPSALHIIRRDQWQRVQHQIDKNKAFSPRNEKHQYLLKGLVRCGACRSLYSGQPCHGRFYYRCMRRCKQNPSITEDRLNHLVWGAVEEAMANPRLIADQLRKLKDGNVWDRTTVEAEQKASELMDEQIEKEESRIIEAYRLGILSSQQLAHELEKMQGRKKAVGVGKIGTEKDDIRISEPEAEKTVEEYCQLVAPRLRDFTLVARQQFLRTLIQEIAFNGSTVRIRGAIPAAAGGGGNASEISPNPGISDLNGDIATMDSGTHGHNGALFPAPSELSLFDRGRNVLIEDLDPSGNLDFQKATEYFHFELERSVPPPVPIKHPTNALGRFVA